MFLLKVKPESGNYVGYLFECLWGKSCGNFLRFFPSTKCSSCL